MMFCKIKQFQLLKKHFGVGPVVTCYLQLVKVYIIQIFIQEFISLETIETKVTFCGFIPV